MDKEIKACFNKWAKIVKPNDKLAMDFISKSRNDIVVLRSMPNQDKEWRAATAYYARYHMITAILLKIGIDCKDHNCSIKIAEHLLSDIIAKNIFDDIKQAKKQRIDLQYYSNRTVKEEDFQSNMEKVDNFVEIATQTFESFTNDKIHELRSKLRK